VRGAHGRRMLAISTNASPPPTTPHAGNNGSFAICAYTYTPAAAGSKATAVAPTNPTGLTTPTPSFSSQCNDFVRTQV
jgi:hypothetical protein